MSDSKRAALRRWAGLLVVGATLAAPAGLGACGGSQSAQTSREERCRAPALDAADCVSRCLECGLGDYGPCAASCQGLARPGGAAGWARPAVTPPPPASGASEGVAALALPAADDADEDWDVEYGERASAAGALEIDLSRLAAGQGATDAIALLLATHREQIRSESVARRAAQKLGLAHSPGYAHGDDEAAARVHRAVRARRRGDSAVIDVRIVDSIDPVLASQICNAVLEAQIERTLELRLEDRRRRGEPADPAALPTEIRVLDRCRPLKPKPSWGFGF